MLQLLKKYKITKASGPSKYFLEGTNSTKKLGFNPYCFLRQSYKYFEWQCGWWEKEYYNEWLNEISNIR